jgi:hypothetical protein
MTTLKAARALAATSNCESSDATVIGIAAVHPPA